MPKKKKSKTPPFVKYILIGAVTIGLGYGASVQMRRVLKSSDYFNVQSVMIDPALEFINKRDLRYIIGRNIFEVDLNLVRQKLSHKYPQASQLRVNRHYPNQISIIAKQRLPFVQVPLAQRVAVLDDESVLLSVESKTDNSVPMVIGATINSSKLVLGLPLEGTGIRLALSVVRLFKDNKDLKHHAISELNISNPSKILFSLDNGLQVIIDQDDIAQKIRVLSVVLAQDALDFKDIKYIDLRFKEPIIGKK